MDLNAAQDWVMTHCINESVCFQFIEINDTNELIC